MMKFSVPPGYVRKKPPAKPKLDAFIPMIDRILGDDKSRPKKQQHTAKRIFDRLSGRTRLHRRHHDREGLRGRLAAAGSGDVRTAGASAGACSGRLW
jgi:hypothetical protein